MSRLLVDSHVHVYDCFDPERFFSAAIRNMNRCEESVHKLLLLTEGKENDFFSRFKENDIRFKNSTYRFVPTKEACALVLMENDKPLCWVLAGRQIVTRENLEVLALASDQKIPDGLPIREVLDKLLAEKSLAVLAWGVGKWFFGRGKIIRDIIAGYRSPSLLIGDNSARPRLWPKPKLFKLAARAGFAVINGSDPLPFPQEESRVGSYGFVLEGAFDAQRPAASLKNLLTSGEKSIQFFGKRDSTFQFFRRQARMFLKKYMKR